jgi:hypothetical protein
MLPPQDFNLFFTLSGLFGTALLGLLVWVGNRLVSAIDALTKNQGDMKTVMAVHEQALKTNKEDIDILKEKVLH